ncbi:MAG: flotillin family protein [Bradymonadaceae bacterium]
MSVFVAVIAILVLAGVAGTVVLTNLIEICQPNEVLVFSGSKSARGFDIVHSGKKIRNPLIHRVDRLDVTNMVIDLNVVNAYSKGGIPLHMRGVANVKIGTQQNQINNAVERFLGMTRAQIIQVAKDTLEGNLRGVLATMTPEEVNDNRILFAQRLSEEAADDFMALGLELDTLNVQHVSDEQGYLDSIGRQQSAELLMTSRIAEANNRTEASVLDAENQRIRAVAKVNAQMEISRADADRRVIDAETRAEAMVAEERSRVGANVAKARASLDVQRARLEQVKRQLAADVIQPAQAHKAELEARAKGNAATFIEDGKANVIALRELIKTWENAGESARPIFLLQQFDEILDSMLSTIQEIDIAKITVIDSSLQDVDRHGSAPMKAASGAEQLKQTLGMDLPRMLQGLAALQEK